jgi:hydroxypyruvate isomerase
MILHTDPIHKQKLPTNLRKILYKLMFDTYHIGFTEKDIMEVKDKWLDLAHQQILALIPKRERCKEGEQYWMWQSVHNVYDYGKMMGKNEAISDMEQSMTGER